VYPKDLRYTKDHEWAKLEGKRVRVGITKFAAEHLSDIVYVELPSIGAELKATETFGVVESVKAVSDLYAPVSGKVVEINKALVDKPDMINTDPYGQAWMVIVEPTNLSELDALLDATAYTALTGEAQS